MRQSKKKKIFFFRNHKKYLFIQFDLNSSIFVPHLLERVWPVQPLHVQTNEKICLFI
jgi:hypothetical protein